MSVEVYSIRDKSTKSTKYLTLYTSESSARNVASHYDKGANYLKREESWNHGNTERRQYEIIKLAPVFKMDGNQMTIELGWVNV